VEHILRDEQILHNCPGKHYDYFYSYVKVRVTPDQIPMLFAISGSVTYDPLKNLLSARCASLEANIATLHLCTNLLLGKEDLQRVHNTDAYGARIRSTSNLETAKKLYGELCQNVQALSTDLNQGYWSGAFRMDGETCIPSKKQLDKIGGRRSSKRKSTKRKAGSRKQKRVLKKRVSRRKISKRKSRK